MRLVLDIIWFVFAGVWLTILVRLAADAWVP